MTPRQKTKLALRSGAEEAWRLAMESLKLISQNKKIFLPLMAMYAILIYLLIGGIAQSDYTQLKEESIDVSDGVDAITKAVIYFGSAVTGGLGTIPSEIQQLMGGIITLVFWFTTVWITRMLTANKKVNIRDGLYNGMTPMVSTFCVLIIITFQLIPAAIGLFGLTSSITEGWITNVAVAFAYGAAAVLLVLITLYWVSQSIIAMAIVALPGMYPIQAFREARDIIMGKRWDVVLRIITVLLLLIIVWAFILIPIFLLDNWLKLEWLPLVPVAVQIVLGASIIFTSIYVYKLYRSLL